MTKASIRGAVQTDAAELARLAAQLGYPVPEASMQIRLSRILNSVGDKLFVAELPGGELAGWIHGFLSQLLESDCRVEIGGLIVDHQWQRRGIGGRLVQAIEDWAVDQEATELSVRCRTDRTEAHTFYSNLSFQRAKTQHVFRKRISTAV